MFYLTHEDVIWSIGLINNRSTTEVFVRFDIYCHTMFTPQPTIRIYDIPNDTFESDEDGDESSEEDDDEDEDEEEGEEEKDKGKKGKL